MSKRYTGAVNFKIEPEWFDKKILKFWVTDDADELLGSAQLDRRSEVARVRAIHLVSGMERRGIGTKIYEKMAEVARENGYTYFCSDATLSPDSRGFWEKQVRKGRAELRDVDYGVGVPPRGRAYCMKLDGKIDFSGSLRVVRKKRKK